jgi:LysR family transcriptional regulator for bpeEF and oprC
MRAMDRLRSMQIYARVVESGSFTRAADALDLPKASVSEHVARLEGHLGVRLLQRTTRRVRLTQDGAAYYARVRHWLDELADLESSLSSAGRAPRGRLRVDVPAAYGRHVLVPALPDFFRRYPELSLELGSSDRPVDLLQEGVDCVVRGGELHDDSLIGRKLGRYQVLTCATPAYLRRHGTPKHPDELRGHALIGYFSAKTGRSYPMDFTREGRRIEIDGPYRIALNDADSYLAAALAGLGVVQIVASARVRASFRSGALKQVLADWTADPLEQYVLWPGRRHLSARVRVFVDWLVEHVGS